MAASPSTLCLPPSVAHGTAPGRTRPVELAFPRGSVVVQRRIVTSAESVRQLFLGFRAQVRVAADTPHVVTPLEMHVIDDDSETCVVVWREELCVLGSVRSAWDLLQHQPFALRCVMRDVCLAMAAAECRGVVHGALSLNDVFLQVGVDGHVNAKVGNFALGRVAGGDALEVGSAAFTDLATRLGVSDVVVGAPTFEDAGRRLGPRTRFTLADLGPPLRPTLAACEARMALRAEVGQLLRAWCVCNLAAAHGGPCVCCAVPCDEGAPEHAVELRCDCACDAAFDSELEAGGQVYCVNATFSRVTAVVTGMRADPTHPHRGHLAASSLLRADGGNLAPPPWPTDCHGFSDWLRNTLATLPHTSITGLRDATDDDDDNCFPVEQPPAAPVAEALDASARQPFFALDVGPQLLPLHLYLLALHHDTAAHAALSADVRWRSVLQTLSRTDACRDGASWQTVIANAVSALVPHFATMWWTADRSDTIVTAAALVVSDADESLRHLVAAGACATPGDTELCWLFEPLCARATLVVAEPRALHIVGPIIAELGHSGHTAVRNAAAELGGLAASVAWCAGVRPDDPSASMITAGLARVVAHVKGNLIAFSAVEAIAARHLGVRQPQRS